MSVCVCMYIYIYLPYIFLSIIFLQRSFQTAFAKTAFKIHKRASLVAQWLRICLLMQETRVRALVWEDPTCHGAAGPVSHSC